MMVRSRRLELPRPFGHSDLNAARLPVPPRPHVHENGRLSKAVAPGKEGASIKAVGGAQWRSFRPASGQCLTPCLPFAPAGVRWCGDRTPSPCRSYGRCRRTASSASRSGAGPAGNGYRSHCSGRADQARRLAQDRDGHGDSRPRVGRCRAQRSTRRISLRNQPFSVSVTVDSSPLGGTFISALLKVAVPPGGRLRAGGDIVHE